jgi:hypothetical protein
MDPYKTNEERVVEFMNYSKHGALSQVFVIHALTVLAQELQRAGLPHVREQLQKRDIPISAEAWYGCAMEWLESEANKSV